MAYARPLRLASLAQDLRRRRFNSRPSPPIAKQERLNAAKKLLVETSRPINVIARECGYSSSWILSRTLKRDAGMTPRDYRREHLSAS